MCSFLEFYYGFANASRRSSIRIRDSFLSNWDLSIFLFFWTDRGSPIAGILCRSSDANFVVQSEFDKCHRRRKLCCPIWCQVRWQGFPLLICVRYFLFVDVTRMIQILARTLWEFLRRRRFLQSLFQWFVGAADSSDVNSIAVFHFRHPALRVALLASSGMILITDYEAVLGFFLQFPVYFFYPIRPRLWLDCWSLSAVIFLPFTEIYCFMGGDVIWISWQLQLMYRSLRG